MVDAEVTPAAAPLSRRLKIVLAALAALGVAALVAIVVILLSSHPASTEASAEPKPTQTVAATPRPTVTATPSATPTTPAVVTPEKRESAPIAPAAPAAPAAPDQPAPAPATPPVIPMPRVDNMAGILNDTSCNTRSYATVVWVTTGGDAKSGTMSIKSSGTPQFPAETWTGMATTDQTDFPFDCTRPLTYFTVTVTNASGSASGLLVWSNSTQSFAPYSPPAQ